MRCKGLSAFQLPGNSPLACSPETDGTIDRRAAGQVQAAPETPGVELGPRAAFYTLRFRKCRQGRASALYSGRSARRKSPPVFAITDAIRAGRPNSTVLACFAGG